MKKILLIIIVSFATISFSACKSDNKAAQGDAVMLGNYIDSVYTIQPVYTETQWKIIDEGYQARNEKLQKEEKELDEAAKAKLEADRKKYEELKIKYDKGIKEANDPEMIANKARMDIRNKLLGEGRPGPNNDWSFVTKDNVVNTYKNFVDRVRDNGANYSDAEWAETRALWKSLNERKDAINKDISTLDKITIDHLKVAFLAVKAVNKPVSQLQK